MELGSELLWKASCAILLCFLVGRLVSLLLSFSVPPTTSADEMREKGSKRSATVDLDHDHGGHKKHLKRPVHGGERLSKIRSSGSKKKKRVKFVDQAAAKAVKFEELLAGEIKVKGLDDVGSRGNEGIEEKVDQKEKGEERIYDLKDEEEKILENVKDGVDEGLLSDEDEWEGVERSELEKEFGRARVFVECQEKEGRFAAIGNDVMMEFYGLQKIAMEGPCHEPQPMALKLSARAKWNAWQRLGSMSPEEAMELYIALLSNIAPGWMDEHSTVEVANSSEGEIHGLADANQKAFVDKRTVSKSTDLTEVSTSVNKDEE